MHSTVNVSVLAVCWLLTGTACSRPSPDGSPAPGQEAESSRYLGEPIPADTPRMFAPDMVSTDAVELNGVFSPDFQEFFFARLIDGVQTLHHSILERGVWSSPRPLYLFPGQTRATADDMALSPDGQRLYFLGRHPHAYDPRGTSPDIWVSERVNGRWAPANVVPPPVSTSAMEVYPVVVADGSLYFTSSRPGGIGPSDLYRAQRLPDGSFAEPVNVGPPINTEFGIGDTYVSPDERFMVFGSRRPPSFGSGDLFVSFRSDDGTWSEPVNLGESINTSMIDYCPMITPDGAFLFFSRRNAGTWADAKEGDVYWVSVRILDQFRRR
jgi:hypothetical protein